MLSRHLRIPSKDVSTVIRTGKSFRTNEAELRVLRTRLPDIRMAVIVSSRIDRRAVRRNRMKRLVTESFRALISDIPPGNDIAVIVRRPLPESSAEVLLLVRELFRRAA